MKEIHVSLLVIPEADPSSLTGMYTVLNLFNSVVPESTSFTAELVVPRAFVSGSDSSTLSVQSRLGLPIPAQTVMEEVEYTDVLIIPSLFTDSDGEWHSGNHPGAISWMKALYAGKGMLCSACTGALLLAETGLLDGQQATQHWAFETTFRRNFPKVKLDSTKVLVASGEGGRIVMSGASAAWHDLVLYLIARFAGPAAARSIAKFFLLQWHDDSLAPFIVFHENTLHNDSIILEVQNWLGENSEVRNPVEAALRLSGLPARSFARRFRKATGFTPINYVQQLRVEAAKQLLETTSVSADEISFRVGYEDAAFFRRVFKRITSLTPGVYRRKFRSIGHYEEDLVGK